MFGRGTIFVVLLGAALLPYVATHPSVREAVTSPLAMVSKQAPEQKQPDATPHTAPFAGPNVDGRANVPPAAAPQAAAAAPRTTSATKLIPLEQALLWEVKPAWVLSTWPRVTTQLPELELQGYRIAYVSGTTETDIAGSLTYYFNAAQRLERIAFSGSTGDARRLVQFLLSHHHFERRFGDDPSTYLYQVAEDGRALSELRIKAAPIVRTGSPLGRFEVAFEIRRPGE